MNKSLEELQKKIEEALGHSWACQKGSCVCDTEDEIKVILPLFNSSLAQYKREIREKIKKMKVPSYPAEGPQAGEMTVMARMGYQDAISDALKELEI